MHLCILLFIWCGLCNINVINGFDVHVQVDELVPDEPFSGGYPLVFPASSLEVSQFVPWVKNYNLC